MGIYAENHLFLYNIYIITQFDRPRFSLYCIVFWRMPKSKSFALRLSSTRLNPKITCLQKSSTSPLSRLVNRSSKTQISTLTFTQISEISRWLNSFRRARLNATTRTSCGLWAQIKFMD